MSTTASSSAVRRPTTKRAYHTWHSKATEQPRSHFEDFLLEIGASSQAQHLCCMPRQVGTDRPLRGHRRMTTSVETRRQSSDNARDLSPNKGSRVPMRGRRREPIVISTASYAGHRTPHPLMLHALEVGGATSLFKVEASSAVNFQTYDAVDSYFSVDISHSSLRSLLGPDAHDEQQLPLPRRDVYDDVRAESADLVATERDHSASPSRSIRRSSSRDSFSTAPSSEAPATPKSHSPLLPEIRPSLADLEHASRFRVQAQCVTCRKPGSNFPSCSRCGETWCSRECRLKGSGGSRHVCHGRGADSQQSSFASHDI